MFKCIKKLFKKENLGHRLGYSLGSMPENSMGALESAIEFQPLDDFKYWEFDVVESADGVLFVFHDATKNKPIDRMCPKSLPYQGDLIYELDYYEIKDLKLLNTNEKVPYASEVIQELVDSSIKPVNVEIKKLLSKGAQINLLQHLSIAKSESEVEFYFSMFKKKLKKMPNKDWFLEQCKNRNIRFKVM